MGLYLCVFQDDEELEGVDVGRYSDFSFFRSSVSELLETHGLGSKFPTLLLHSDSDGEWSVSDCKALKDELMVISEAFSRLPAIQFESEWQRDLAKLLGLRPSSLMESFIDVDGEVLVYRLVQLCDAAIAHDVPVLFQ